jgi:hypothetical protein
MKLIRPAALLVVPVALAIATSGVVLAQDLGQECRNPEAGYTVDFPTGWYTNDAVDGGEVGDVAACRFFSPEKFEVRPASEIAGVAISIRIEASDPPQTGEATTVDGKPARIIASETEVDSVEPAGTRHYEYWIDIGDAFLVAGTSDGPTWVGEYDENRSVLDAMMDSLSFRTPGLPDTAVPIGGLPLSGLIGSAALVGAGLMAARRRDATDPLR